MFGSRKKAHSNDPRSRENVDKQDYKVLAATTGVAIVAAAPAVAVVFAAGTVLAAVAIADAVFNSDG